MNQSPVIFPTFSCQCCGHVWIPRVTYPVRCPSCKNPKWNTPKVPAPIEPGPAEPAV